MIWSPAGDQPKPIQLTNAKLQQWDILGRPQSTRTFTPSETPVYIVGEGVSAEDFEKAIAAGPPAQP